MKYYELEDNFLKKYNPVSLDEYIKLKWRESGRENFMDTSERVIFQIVRSGSLKLEMGPYNYELKPGYGFIMDLSEKHFIHVEKWEEFDVSTIVYPYRVINKFYNSIIPKEENIFSNNNDDNESGAEGENHEIYLQPRVMEITPKINDLVAQIRNPLKNQIFGGTTESLLSSKMLLLYILRLNNQPGAVNYLTYEPKGSVNQELRQRLKLVQEYIHQNFNKNITLHELASIACISKNYFVKIFKDGMGRTPMDYLAMVRVEKAKDYLLHTNKPIQRISYEIGFGSISSFSQFFTRLVGCSPTEFRIHNGITV